MSEQNSLLINIKPKENGLSNKTNISGIDHETFLFYLNKLSDNQDNQIYLFENNDDALNAMEKLELKNSIYYPTFECDPYSSMRPSESLLNQRHLALTKVLKLTNYKVFTTLEALHLKAPPISYFKKDDFILTQSDIISPEELKAKLISIGYNYTPSIEEEGTFTNKGEIFDIYPFNQSPIRIHYFDDMIEEIFEIDLDTLKTNRDEELESVSIQSSAMEVLSKKSIQTLRSNLYKPTVGQKAKIDYRNEIFHKLNNGYFFDRFPIYFSSFFEEHNSFLEYLTADTNIFSFNYDEQASRFKDIYQNLIEDFELEKNDNNNPNVSPYLENLYYKDITLDNFKITCIDDFKVDEKSCDFKFTNLNVFLRSNNQSTLDNKYDYNKALLEAIKSLTQQSYKLIITYRNDNSKIQLDYLLDENNLNPYSSIKYNLSKGFIDEINKYVILSEADLFSVKTTKHVKQKRNESLDVFAEQLSTLSIGDYVIHKTYGVGKYLGIDTLEHGSNNNDFLVIEYQGSDKVYLPVYKLDLIQKHANNTLEVKVDNLNSNKFELTKKKAKNSVKKLAFDLLELQAKRATKKGYAFSEPDSNFKDFELAFAYEETPDQLYAINDVLEDMQKSKPMDRLVCGDVGFGKTEVAMRASFKAVLDNKQVAVLVPTTVLAYQHYNTFIKRFKNFPVNIEFISRLKTAKEVKEIIEKLEEGKIDILIGTHKLLSSKIKYNDLGLLVIDEEQRFGVTHKEKLKLLKENVDCLTLTATPIPRTLQLSFLGIKELSIIKSAPPKRQSIKSYVIKEDPSTLKAAINKELKRAGQLFIVHNRVHDIENYAAYIAKLVPEANIVIAHGQLNEKELEKRISAFYNKKYDILISTTIIESGIDIPSANTLIVDKAHTFGLSQLHQLRGRIGRSDKKAYAYFITPHDKNLSDIAKKRLKSLQTYADLGSGFSLATNDLEIRGSGDILGAEQSGHIAQIGLELYMDLLKDAIGELKNSNKNDIQIKRDVEFITPFNCTIPASYIHDTGSRLKFYKKLSNCESIEGINIILEDLKDQYGLIPNQLDTLATILKCKIRLKSYPLKSIKVTSSKIIFKFDVDELNKEEKLRDKFIQLFMSRPKVYKMSPDYTVKCLFKDEITPKILEEFVNYVASQI